MDIYERACASVPDEDKFEMYQLYIGRASEFFGVTKTRSIYEKVIQQTCFILHTVVLTVTCNSNGRPSKRCLMSASRISA